ncbi:hypothetical protein ACH5RR_000615 [Cinchona calisaya]|uniref:CCHC-type domain-containing protein n=1 Tax=Cinchona calisaya TaxID=153742 RepID=A0ABD3B196_9GENT
MAGQRHKPNVDQPSSHQRDLRDIELDELRRQVQQLQQRLERGKAPEHEVYDHVSKHDLSENAEDVNPFHHFEGKHDVDEFIDWLNTIERFFELKDVPDNQKVKIAAIKLKKHASIWWEHLKKQRVRDGKGRIVSWDKMKKASKKKFLPENYRQDVFLKFHSFKQNNLSVVDYTAEFEDLMLRCDIYEPEEQTIDRYLGGLRIEICNVVQLQPYWTFHDVCKLALKVEKQLKDSKIGGFRFNQQGGTTNRIGSSTTQVSTPTTQVTKSTKGETNMAGSSRPNTSNAHRKCFKCQGFGHIASDCPNRKIVSLMEEDILEETEEEPIYDEGHEEDIIYEDHGEALVCTSIGTKQYCTNIKMNSGKLLLVHLAVFEKVEKTEVEGRVLEEAKTINKSFSAFGHDALVSFLFGATSIHCDSTPLMVGWLSFCMEAIPRQLCYVGACQLREIFKAEDVDSLEQLFVLEELFLDPVLLKRPDTIDCIDIYRQPALDHPLLKNHTIQMWPSIFPGPFG